MPWYQPGQTGHCTSRRLSSCVASSIFPRLRGFWATWGWRVHVARAFRGRHSKLPPLTCGTGAVEASEHASFGVEGRARPTGNKILLPLSHYMITLDWVKRQSTCISSSFVARHVDYLLYRFFWAHFQSRGTIFPTGKCLPRLLPTCMNVSKAAIQFLLNQKQNLSKSKWSADKFSFLFQS